MKIETMRRAIRHGVFQGVMQAAVVCAAVVFALATVNAMAEPKATPITIESSRGLGNQGPGGSDNLAVTEAFLAQGSNNLPYLFYWHSGVGVKCAVETCICMSQAWPSDFSVDARCFITDLGTAPNDNDGFGACRKIGTTREFFKISRQYMYQGDATARRDGVCETPAGRENGYPCNDAADCRVSTTLDPEGDDVCDTSVQAGKTAFERTWGVFLMGAQDCDWTSET